jgi:hypothetical protein
MAKTLPKGEHQANFVAEFTHRAPEHSVMPEGDHQARWPNHCCEIVADKFLGNRCLQQAGSDEGAEALYGKHDHKR